LRSRASMCSKMVTFETPSLVGEFLHRRRVAVATRSPDGDENFELFGSRVMRVSVNWAEIGEAAPPDGGVRRIGEEPERAAACDSRSNVRSAARRATEGSQYRLQVVEPWRAT